MTNKEYLTKSLSGLGITEDDIDIILLKGGISADAEADFSACDLAVYNRVSLLLKVATQNVTEGGYSISWNIEAVKLYYATLCRELGKPNVLGEVSQPEIRNKSYIW